MKLALSVLAALAFAAPALAQDPPQGQTTPTPAVQAARAAMRSACAADMASLCASAADGRSRMQCLRSNQDKLSDGCKSAWEAVRAARQAPADGSQ